MWNTAAQVPFHPDESTYLFMAQDGRWFWRQPTRLFYRPSRPSLRQHYRLVDAPFTRWYLGTVLLLTGRPALPADWDWGASWEANGQRAALPAPDLLLTARRAMVILLVLAVPGIYLAGRALAGEPAGWIAALIFMTHPLVLLHGRRAMMEGPLLWATSWFLATLTARRFRAGAAGLTLGLALAAKPLALPLALPACWRLFGESPTPRAAARGAFSLVTLGLGVYVLLNPVFWRYPWQAVQAAWQKRLQVTRQQRQAFLQEAPVFVPQSVQDRGALLLVMLFGPVQYAELDKYHAVLQPERAAYEARWGWLHHPFLQAARLFLGVLGLWWLFRHRAYTPAAVAFLVGFGAVHLFLLLTLPLAFQRYVVGLVPWWAVASGAAGCHLIQSLGSMPGTKPKSREQVRPLPGRCGSTGRR